MVLLSRNPDNFDPIVQDINSNGGEAIGISTDVADANSVNSAFDEIAKKFPNVPLAATIFNPGGGFARKPFLELTEEDFSLGFDSQA